MVRLQTYSIVSGGHLIRGLPGPFRDWASFAIGIAAYFCGNDFLLDFVDVAVATNPTPTWMQPKSGAILVAGASHLATVALDQAGPSAFDIIKALF